MDELRAMANKRPADRTAHEQREVDRARNIQEIRNRDFESQRQARAGR